MSIQKRRNVIADVILAYESGNLIPSTHASEQMDRRNVQISDVEEMIYNAEREEQKDSMSNDGTAWKYALRGPNNNRDKDIRIIVVFSDADTIIVTVIDKNK